MPDRNRHDIAYAKQSITRGEPENQIIGAIIQQSYPNNPVQGYDYARYILAEARFALHRETSIHKEQSSMNNGSNHNGSSSNRDRNSEQYKRDWSYALRALEKGDAPEKVIQGIAAFRKDLPDFQKYAKATVAKAQQHLQIRDELVNVHLEKHKQLPNYADLDKSLKQASQLEFARHLYEDGANRETVTEFLKRDHRLGEKKAANLAQEAETRFFAERDLNYAIRARERGEGDDRIIPKVAEYREGKVENPQDYARAILAAADNTREAEHHQSKTPLAQDYVAIAQQLYRRDLQYAVFQLEHRTPGQVRVDVSERRPEKAYESPSFQVHGQPAHSYSVAVVEQAEKIREVTDRGRNLEDTLEVAEREFGRRLQQATNLQEAGHGSNQVIQNLTEKARASEPYARAVLNQAYMIGEQQRQASIRPEMARAALAHAKPAKERTPARATVAVER